MLVSASTISTPRSATIPPHLSTDATFASPLPIHPYPQPAEWQLRAQAKRAEREALIPSRWRLPPSFLEQWSDVDLRDAPRQCGLLSPQELEITETDNASDLLAKMASGEWSAVDVTLAFSGRAAIAHQLTNCLTEIVFEQALKRAAELDDYLERTGQVVGPLHGLPVSLKDQFDMIGVDSTMGFVSLINKPAANNSVFVDMMYSLGAVVHVKTNVPQTLMSEESNNYIFGRTINPNNRNLIPGGSSGGEGALLALKGSIMGMGTDFGGSIRKPSAYCGLYGLRPTTRRLPYQGVSNVLHGFEGIESVIGPMARSVDSLEVLMKAIIGAEPWNRDARVIERAWSSTVNLPKKLRVALLSSDNVVHNHPPIQRGLDKVSLALAAAGHEVIRWAPFDHVKVRALFGNLAAADGGADTRSFVEGTGEPIIPEAFPFTAANARSVYDLNRLVEERNIFRQEFLDRWMTSQGSSGRPVDLIICPAAPHVAVAPRGSPRQAELITWTAIWSLIDLPVCTLPVGRVLPDQDLASPLKGEPFSAFDAAHWETYSPEDAVNAPIVLQLVNPRRHREDNLLAMTAIVEKAVLAL